MAKEWARDFYVSPAWRVTRDAYGLSQHWLCERCGRPGRIVHHRKHLTPTNIMDQCIALAISNLELLCQDCHNAEHQSTGAAGDGLRFDSNGDLVRSGAAGVETPRVVPEKSVEIMTECGTTREHTGRAYRGCRR